MVGQFAYNDQHLPLTVIDAAGQTNAFGYNAYGQLTALTNALGETATLNYDTNGYLTNITGALSGATTDFTYDDYGRVRTVTDSDGYTVTTDYDALDRPTRVTYPDGTYQEIVYDKLDPVLARDRRGLWTAMVYDSSRRLTAVQDALGRVTRFGWCGCGSLESITDPFGRVTTWLRDAEFPTESCSGLTCRFLPAWIESDELDDPLAVNVRRAIDVLLPFLDGGTVTFPSQFMLVAAMNPTPDGKMPGESHCSPREIQNYLNLVSGPLLDRIDLHVEVPAVKFQDITSQRNGEPSATIRERVIAARRVQQDRFKHRPRITCNARMGTRELKAYCALDEATLALPFS